MYLGFEKAIHPSLDAVTETSDKTSSATPVAQAIAKLIPNESW